NALQSSEFGAGVPAAPRGRLGAAVPIGTFAAAYSPTGVLLDQLSLSKSQTWTKPDSNAIPAVPRALAVGRHYTVTDSSGARYRVVAMPMREVQGVTSVV